MWNYRVLQYADFAEIVEVYYNDDGDIYAWSRASLVQDSVNDLLRDLAAIQQAFAAPILKIEDMPGGEEVAS
jgi:hypothetical protein